MGEQTKWVTRHVECPEGKGKSELLVELRDEIGKDVVNAISCSNPYLQDLGGGDCQWSCWEKVSENDD